MSNKYHYEDLTEESMMARQNECVNGKYVPPWLTDKNTNCEAEKNSKNVSQNHDDKSCFFKKALNFLGHFSRTNIFFNEDEKSKNEQLPFKKSRKYFNCNGDSPVICPSDKLEDDDDISSDDSGNDNITNHLNPKLRTFESFEDFFSDELKQRHKSNFNKSFSLPYKKNQKKNDIRTSDGWYNDIEFKNIEIKTPYCVQSQTSTEPSGNQSFTSETPSLLSGSISNSYFSGTSAFSSITDFTCLTQSDYNKLSSQQSSPCSYNDEWMVRIIKFKFSSYYF